MSWTPLHAALGEPPSDLSYAMFERAIDQQVVETDELDWKRTLPGNSEAEKQEFGKDVAAMSNTRGGMIVYGVAEERGQGTAKEIMPVENGETAQSRLRALAAARVHPFVAGLSMVSIDDPTSPGRGILVVLVPQSPDAPHVLSDHEKLAVPIRDGTGTRWMRERDLERAYRERFGRQSDEQAALATDVADMVDRLDLSLGVWLVAAARPRTPAPFVVGSPTRQQAIAVLAAARASGLRLVPATGESSRFSVIESLGDSALNPRPGLRRWISGSGRFDGTVTGKSQLVHAEIHHDGAVSMAMYLRPCLDLQRIAHQVPQPLVESFSVDLVGFVDAAAQYLLGGPTRFGARLEVVQSSADAPLVVIDVGRHGNFRTNPEIVRGSSEISRVRPVLTEVTAPADTSTLLAGARELASDVLNQFGIGTLHVIPSS